MKLITIALLYISAVLYLGSPTVRQKANQIATELRDTCR